MAECVRQGLRKIIEQHGVPACVYGESSSLHLYIGSRSIEGRDANTLEHVSTTVQNHFPQALQVRGVDLMSRCSGVFSYSLRFLSVLPYRGGYVY